jgi:hypothetical protein
MPGVGVTDGTDKAESTVTEDAEAEAEVTPKLSVTVTVTEREPTEEAENV